MRCANFVLCRVCSRTAGVCLVAGAAIALPPVPPTSLAQERQIDFGWDDPFFGKYLARRNADAASGRSRGGVRFSIPVIGFEAESSGADASLGTLQAQLASEVRNWPRCAASNPVSFVTVPENADQAAGSKVGSWFTSTYDFGCLQVVVEGDGNVTERGFDSQAGSTPESGTIEISRNDENSGVRLDQEGRELPGDQAGGIQGQPEVTYTRGNLTYTVTVSCQMESLSFCGSDQSIRSLIEQLKPIAGEP